jgi:cell division GTPase FtsZ
MSRIVVIGGGQAGTSLVAKLCSEGFEGQVTLLFISCSFESMNCSRTCFKLAFSLFIQALIVTNLYAVEAL